MAAVELPCLTNGSSFIFRYRTNIQNLKARMQCILPIERLYLHILANLYAKSSDLDEHVVTVVEKFKQFEGLIEHPR